jgi:hypothetical protein
VRSEEWWPVGAAREGWKVQQNNNLIEEQFDRWAVWQMNSLTDKQFKRIIVKQNNSLKDELTVQQMNA